MQILWLCLSVILAVIGSVLTGLFFPEEWKKNAQRHSTTGKLMFIAAFFALFAGTFGISIFSQPPPNTSDSSKTTPQPVAQFVAETATPIPSQSAAGDFDQVGTPTDDRTISPTPASVSTPTTVTRATAIRSSTPTQARILLPTNTPRISAGYSQSNPIPLGQSVLWTGRQGEQVRFKLIEFHRGDDAWTRIRYANRYNQVPPPGWEYLLFKVRADVLDAGKPLSMMMADSWFVVVSSTGRQFQSYEGPTIVPPDPLFLKKVFVGDFVEGWMAFSILAGDSRPLLAFGQTIFPDEMRIWFDIK